MTTRVLILLAVAVFLPACATAGGPYGSPYGRTPVIGGGISITDALCAGVGVGAGLGTGKATKNTGWGVSAGAGAALLCKGVTDAAASHPVYGNGGYPPVYHQPGPVMIPSGVYIPDGYQLERIDVQNATRGVIFVRTPQGMERVDPGGMVSFYEAISTGAGGAFYAVHATATVQVPGGYQSRWAHEFGNSNGTLVRTVVFKDFRWDNKMVSAYAATRHEIAPPPAVYGAPGVQADPPAPPVSK